VSLVVAAVAVSVEGVVSAINIIDALRFMQEEAQNVAEDAGVLNALVEKCVYSGP
jgi:hypothetical protein